MTIVKERVGLSGLVITGLYTRQKVRVLGSRNPRKVKESEEGSRLKHK